MLKAKQSKVAVIHTFNPSTWETHTFNPSTREVETGRDMTGQREEYKVGGDKSSRHLFSLRIRGDRILPTLV